MHSVLRRTSARLLASTPNYLEVTALILIAALSRLILLPGLWNRNPALCIAPALVVVAFLYALLGKGRIFEYLGWVRPRRAIYWLYAVAGGLVGAGIGICSVHLAGHSLGTAPPTELLYGATLGPVVEEAVYRGAGFSVVYVLACSYKTTARLRIALPVLITATLFAFSHAGVYLLSWLIIFSMGVGYALLRWRSNSVAVSAVMHTTYNLAIAIAMLSR